MNALLQKLYGWYGKRAVQAVIAVIIILVGIGIYLVVGDSSPETEETEVEAASVTIAPVRDMAPGGSFAAVGTVKAVSEAQLQTERGGRITSVNVELGQTVAAGTVIASLENQSERAALLQAEGSYEAALAGAQQGDSGARDAATRLTAAENSALSTVRAAYTTANNTLLSSIDRFFSNPSGQVPGVKIEGNTSYLNSERVQLQTIMPAWQGNVERANSTELSARFTEAKANTTRLIAMVDSLIAATNDAQKQSDTLDGAPVSSYTAGLLAERSALNASLAAIQAAESELSTAKEAVDRAAIGGTSSDVSLANAQVKIALGSLRAAQANYEKTLVRSPIRGVVNALYLKAGEYASPSAPAAIIANNNGLEITTSVTEEESSQLTVGDQASIDGTATGTVTAIAGAIDPTTGKVAVKVSVNEDSELKNGSTVSVSFNKESVAEVTDIVIPLSSVKMTGSGPIAFKVGGESALEAIPLTLGAVSGDSVVVSSGLTLDSVIVVDARGLKEGQAVSVTNN